MDCVIEDENLEKKSPKPSSRNDRERSSVDSTSSSSGSSEKGKTEVNVKKIEEKNAVDLKQKEAIKKQMAERKKSAGSEKTGNRQAAKQRGEDEDISVRRSAEDVKKAAAGDEKRPLPGAVKSKTPKAEVWIYLFCKIRKKENLNAVQRDSLRISLVWGYKPVVFRYTP